MFTKHSISWIWIQKYQIKRRLDYIELEWVGLEESLQRLLGIESDLSVFK